MEGSPGGGRGSEGRKKGGQEGGREEGRERGRGRGSEQLSARDAPHARTMRPAHTHS